MRKALVLLALVGCSLSTAFAQSYGDLKFSGNIYSFFYWNLSSTQPIQNSFVQEAGEPAALNYNQFDIERVYFNIKSQLSAATKLRVTTDIYRNAAYPANAGAAQTIAVKDSAGKTIGNVTIPGAAAATSYYNGLTARLKYAYFDWSASDDLSFRMGMQQTPWYEFSEEVWKYRGVQQTAADKNKFLSSADLGFSATYLLPSQYGSLSAYVFNGNGYTAPEFNRFKDVAVRLQIVPMPTDEHLKELKITFMDYMGSNLATAADQSTGAIKNNILGAMLSYQGEQFNLAAEYLSRQTGTTKSGVILDSTNTASVISIFGSVKAPGELKEYLELFARVDMYTPTNADISSVTDATANANNTKNTLIIAGLAWKPAAKLTLALDYQGTSFSHPIASQFDGTTLVGTKAVSSSDARLLLHGIVTF